MSTCVPRGSVYSIASSVEASCHCWCSFLCLPIPQLADISGGMRRALAKKDKGLLCEKLSELNNLHAHLKCSFNEEYLLKFIERAVSIGFLPGVKLFLPYIVSPDSTQVRTTLQIQTNIAAQQGNFEIAQALCEYHPICLQQTSSGDVPTIHAARHDSPAALGLLQYLVENGVCVNLQNPAGTTALHSAVKFFNRPATELLLESRACVTMPDQKGVTPLMLSRGAPLEPLLVEAMQYDDHPAPEEASLYLAALKGDCSLVQELIDEGLGVNTQWVGGKTALHGAVESEKAHGCLQIVQCLLDNGAAILPIHNDPELFVINRALSKGKIEIASFLLARLEAQLQRCLQEDSNTLSGVDIMAILKHTLFLCAQNSYLDILRSIISLCSQGKVFSVSDFVHNDQFKLIHVGARYGQTAVVDAVVSLGEDPTSGDVHGNTPLHYACYYGNIETARRLLQYEGVDVNGRNSHGFTALYCILQKKIFTDTCEQCLERSVIFLLTHGAKLVTPSSTVCQLREAKIDDEFNERWAFVSPHTRKLILALREYNPPLKLAELCRLQVRSLMTHPSDKTFQRLPLAPSIMAYLRCD